jgi:hypothetical protein
MLGNIRLFNIGQDSIRSTVMKPRPRLARETAKVVALDSFCSARNLPNPVRHVLRLWHIAERSNKIIPSFRIKQGIAYNIYKFIEFSLNIVGRDWIAIEDRAENEDWKPRDEQAHCEIMCVDVTSDIAKG